MSRNGERSASVAVRHTIHHSERVVVHIHHRFGTYSILPVKELSDVTEEHGYRVLQLDSV